MSTLRRWSCSIRSLRSNGLTLRECTLRWSAHHSLLEGERGDAVLVGASHVAHLESNLVNLEKAPLPDEIFQVLNRSGGEPETSTWIL